MKNTVAMKNTAAMQNTLSMTDTVLLTEETLFSQNSGSRKSFISEALLLRACQLGIAIGGILLILSGYGIGDLDAGWLRLPAVATLAGGIAGLIHENRLSRRGEGQGPVALMLPAAGLVSGIFALMVNV